MVQSGNMEASMKISLINMPFAPLGSPSIGLTQIAAAVKMRFGEQVDLQTHYLNLDFGAQLKETGFYAGAVAPYARISGLPDWFFRSAAFPESADNIEEYLARYYFDGSAKSALVVDFVRSQRQKLYGFLDELIGRYALASSDIVGFSLCFFQTTASIALARRLKALNPDIMIVFGGPAVKGVPGRTLLDNIACIDYVFSGPALHSFPELVARCLAGAPVLLPPIPGVFARDVACALPPEQVAGENIDINTDLPLDYAPFLDKFAACIKDPAILPYLLLQTSRGCWWADKQRCTFCGLNSLSERFEAMAPEHALRHIRSVLGYSERVSYFVACDNMAPPHYFQEVFPCLEAQEGVFIKYETRPDLSVADIQTLCNAGIRCVQPGVEALATESLKLMRKGVSAFSNIRFLKDCAQHELYAEWNLLLFSPGESEEVYRKYELDIPWLTHLQPPVGVFPIEFVRDSCYFEQAQAFGLELEPHESLAYIYPFDQATITGLCFRFTDRNADTAKINLWLDRLGVLINGWRDRWCGALKSRPRLILWRDEHSALIHDSRCDTEVDYRITDEAEALLQAMARTPLTVTEAARQSGVEKHAARVEIQGLKERHLLFKENSRYLSLAIEG